MPRRREGARILGPYNEAGQWRIVCIDEERNRSALTYDSEVAAKRAAERLRSELEKTASKTVSEVLQHYEMAMRAKGNKPNSANETLRRLRRFFADGELPIKAITAKMCEEKYKELINELAVDSHRSILTHARTFTKWAVKERFLSQDPLVNVLPVGKKKKGKPQLRVDEARLWLAKALELAPDHDGAIAAAMTLLLGLRATEITQRLVRDIDDAGQVVWITSSKTEAGKRMMLIPEILRPHLIRLASGRPKEELLFGRHLRDWPKFWVRRICQLAGVPVVSAHAMRGLYGTMGTLNGHDRRLQELSKQLGHANTRITKMHYIAPGVEEIAQQKASVSLLLGDSEPFRNVPVETLMNHDWTKN